MSITMGFVRNQVDVAWIAFVDDFVRSEAAGMDAALLINPYYGDLTKVGFVSREGGIQGMREI